MLLYCQKLKAFFVNMLKNIRIPWLSERCTFWSVVHLRLLLKCFVEIKVHKYESDALPTQNKF